MTLRRMSDRLCVSGEKNLMEGQTLGTPNAVLASQTGDVDPPSPNRVRNSNQIWSPVQGSGGVRKEGGDRRGRGQEGVQSERVKTRV